MDIKQVKLIYFSATGTTQKVLESIAKGIGVEDVEYINLTYPGDGEKMTQPFSDELVIIGAPVYGGRLPVDVVNRFERLKAQGTLAVLIVLYGNREFEDALLELKNISSDLGFIPAAGGAFIGEHSFARKDLPIANGRPDNQDVQKAIDFGARIKDKIAALESPDALTELEVPGHFPYEAAGARPMTVAPVTKEDDCTLCGTCAEVCPTAAISINDSVETEIKSCIRCCACIKNCPEDARKFEDKMMEEIAHWLNENCGERKEPQVFGIEM